MKQLNVRIHEEFIKETFDKIDNQIICEKLECTVLKDVAKQLIGQRKTHNENIKIEKEKYFKTGRTYWPGPDASSNQLFKDIFSGYNSGIRIEWSKITDKSVTIYEPEDINKKLDAITKKIIDGKEHGMVIIQDPETNKFTYVIFTYGSVVCLEGTTDGTAYSYNTNKAGAPLGHHNGRGNWVDIRKNEKLALMKNKRVYYVDLTGKYDEYLQTRRDRDESMRNTIPLDPYLVSQIAKDNVNRYKKIISQMKAKRDNADQLLDDCNIVIKKIAELATEVAKDAIVNADMIEPVAKLSAYVYDTQSYHWPSKYNKQGYYSGVNGLLPQIMKYADARKKSSSDNYAEMYAKDMETAKKNIQDSLNKIIDIAKKYDIDLGI